MVRPFTCDCGACYRVPESWIVWVCSRCHRRWELAGAAHPSPEGDQ